MAVKSGTGESSLKKKAVNTNKLKSQKGLATLETLPLLVIFLVLISYGLGLFGVIHTAILHSIGARAYAFETFRSRSNLIYFRENVPTSHLHHENIGFRFHFVSAENTENDEWTATGRPLAIGRSPGEAKGQIEDHNSKIYDLPFRNREGGVEVSPIWVMVGYGICITADCGDNQ